MKIECAGFQQLQELSRATQHLDFFHGNTVYLNHNLAKGTWRVNRPEKVEFFIWSLAHGSLNTSDKIQSSSLQTFEPFITREESINHLLYTVISLARVGCFLSTILIWHGPSKIVEDGLYEWLPARGF